jgi:Spherulation-specific family 4
MQMRKLALVAGLTLLGPLLLPAVNAAAQSSALVSGEHIITTLYAYPGLSVWDQVTSSAPTVSASIADMCAGDGTGSGCDGKPWDEQPPEAWTTQIQALQEAGITPLIYISTDYGDEGGSTDFSLATVESEVSNAVKWYGKGIGFMFDEAATSCPLESSYYAPLYSYVKSVTNGGTVELNPGAVPSSCYMAASDVLQVFEGSETQFQAASFPSWMTGYPRDRFAATISAGTTSGVSTDVGDAAKDDIGNVYVDDEAEPPSYSTLPAFWSAEVADVAGIAPAGAAAQHITLPLYAAPTASAWTQVEDAAPTVRAAIVDICAPDGTGSGCDGKPADEANPAWPPTIGALRSAGVLPLYYISTDYAATPAATVESEVSNAISWYGTPSILLDEVTTSCSDVSYYQTLYSYIHSLGGIVMLDPGTVTSASSCYMPAADILEVFSGTQASFQTATFPSWMTGYASSRFAAVISAGTSAGVGNDVAIAAADGIGNVYIDSEAEPPTYATLPAFWSTEVADVRAEP